MTTMYCRDQSGNIRVWMIEREGFDIVIVHGVQGGSLQEKREEVLEGKAARSVDEQIMSMMASRIHKQIDKGYVNDIDKVGDRATNALGLYKPMLAAKFRDVKNIDYSTAYLQYKYDGNRCLITKHNGELIAYSRNGKCVKTIQHILDQIDIEEGETLDGELYAHGYKLQTIVSWIKRLQPDTAKIKYHVYDIVSDKPYKDRFSRLESLSTGTSFEIVPTAKVGDEQTVQGFYNAARKAGYEGAIIRWGNKGYEDGKRSKSLVKVKGWIDEEFVVMDIIESKDGWARLVCYKDGKKFKVSAPGSMDQKYEVMLNFEHYVGRSVRIEYAFLTKDGVPFHPVATNWRNKNEE